MGREAAVIQPETRRRPLGSYAFRGLASIPFSCCDVQVQSGHPRRARPRENCGIRPLGPAPVDVPQEVLLFVHMKDGRTELLQGTLDLLILRTLAQLGPLHGFGIARRLEQVSGDTLSLNQGTVYPALVRLEQRGWISSEWGTSENNRRARYYRLSAAGRRQLKEEVANWERLSALVQNVLTAE